MHLWQRVLRSVTSNENQSAEGSIRVYSQADQIADYTDAHYHIRELYTPGSTKLVTPAFVEEGGRAGATLQICLVDENHCHVARWSQLL